MWELNCCVGLILSYVSAAALIAHVGWLIRISSWLGFLSTVWATCVTAPGFRFDIHWRSLFLYAFTVFLAIISAVELGKGEEDLFSFNFRVAYGVVYLVVCIITSVVYYYCPVSANPRISGKYKNIGTTSFTTRFSDPTVDPAYSSLAIQCWFPIEYSPSIFEQYTLLWTSGHPQHQLEESMALSAAITKSNGIPAFVTNHLALGRTKSIWQYAFDKLINKEELPKLPIAIYSHGMYGWRQIHHTACEKLASEGFIVFACDHTPDCLLTRPLGEVTSYFDFATPKGIEPLQERAFFQSGLESRVVQLRELIAHVISDKLTATYPELHNRLDYDHVNLWGHSFGGLTISALCCRGASLPFRINSAVVLDGWMYPLPEEDRQKGLYQTSLLNISADKWVFGKYQVPFRNDLVKNTIERGSGRSTPVPIISPSPTPATTTEDLATMTEEGHVDHSTEEATQFVLDLVLQGAAHQNFVDLYFMGHRSLLEVVKMVGTVDLRQTIKTINHILPMYFNGVAALKRGKGTSGYYYNTSVSVESVSLEGLEANELVSKHPFVSSPHEEIVRLGEICHAGRLCMPGSSNTSNTGSSHSGSVLRGADGSTTCSVCLGNTGATTTEETILPAHIVRFVHKHMVPAKCMPGDYTSYAAWDVVMNVTTDASEDAV